MTGRFLRKSDVFPTAKSSNFKFMTPGDLENKVTMPKNVNKLYNDS